MKQLLLSITILLVYLVGNAQEEYKINGTIEGLSNSLLFLISDKQGKLDTLSRTQSVNGQFEFSGKVESPMAVYITTANRQGMISLILENTEFTIRSVAGGVVVKGGRQQEIYNHFLALNSSILWQQMKFKQEIQTAKREGNDAKIQSLAEAFNQILEESQRKEKELLTQHADTYVAAHIVASGMHQQNLQALQARYELLGKAAKATAPGLATAAMIESMKKIAVGNIASDFTVTTPDARVISLYTIKGKAKLIHFWASGNTLSRQQNVELLNIYQRYSTKGLALINISLDQDRSAWIKAINEDGAIWDNGLDLKDGQSQVASLFFVRDIPYTLLLDENNTIVAINLQGPALRNKIAEMLKRK